MEKSCKSALTFLASRSIFMIFGTLHFSLKSLKKEKKSPSIFFLTLKYRLFFYRVLWKRVFENQTASNTSALKVNVMSFFRCSFRVLGITPVLLDHCAIEKTMTKFLENISLKAILIPLGSQCDFCDVGSGAGFCLFLKNRSHQLSFACFSLLHAIFFLLIEKNGMNFSYSR